MTKIPNINRINKYQTPQMVSTYIHKTLHDITEGTCYSIYTVYRDTLPCTVFIT